MSTDTRSWLEENLQDIQWSGDEGKARCPLHEDTTPSLSVNAEKRCWKCFAGCGEGKLSDLAKLAGWSAPPWNGNPIVAEPRQASTKKEKPAAVIPVPPEAIGKLTHLVNLQWARERYGQCTLLTHYRDATGLHLFSVARYEGNGKKSIRPYYYSVEDKWREGHPLRDGRPLLNLPEIAAHPELPILIVEGEKCANVTVPGYIVTTWTGGSGSIGKTDFSPLADRSVTIWPDHDDAGRKAAAEIASLLPASRTLSIGADKPRGWDIADAAAEKIDLGAFIQGHLLEEDDISTPEANVKDYGHAKVLAPFFLGRYRWAVHSHKWMRYTRARWVRETEEKVASVATQILRKEYSRRLEFATEKNEIEACASLLKEVCVFARILGALSFLKGWNGIHTTAEEWDADKWALNCHTGTIDLHTGELHPHHSEDLITKLARVDYDPAASSEKWQAHLDLFLPDKDIQRQVQRDMGLSLPGVTLEETLGIWYGHGGNGKTTTSRILMQLLGDYASRAAPNLLIQSKWERHPTELADLANVRLVFSIEIDQGKKLAESLVKELTGGDTKKARHLYEDFFEFQQTFSIVLLVNHKPEIEGTDEAIWRRIRLVPWTQTITADRKRPQEDVVAELVREGPAILNWILAGLRDWQGDHGWVAAGVQAATAEYREQSDRIGPFLRERCERNPRFRVPLPELQNSYVEWCAEEQEDPLSKREFEKLLRDHGFSTRREGHGQIHTWQGIKVIRRLDATRLPELLPHESNPGKSYGNTSRQESQAAVLTNSDAEIDDDEGLF